MCCGLAHDYDCHSYFHDGRDHGRVWRFEVVSLGLIPHSLLITVIDKFKQSHFGCGWSITTAQHKAGASEPISLGKALADW
jgi:hypothetical protein